MIHDEKTTELELPGYTPTTKAPQSTSPIPAPSFVIRGKVEPKATPTASSIENQELTWILRLLGAVAVLVLSVWIL